MESAKWFSDVQREELQDEVDDPDIPQLGYQSLSNCISVSRLGVPGGYGRWASIMLAVALAPTAASGAPVGIASIVRRDHAPATDNADDDPQGASFWFNMAVSALLVVLGGIFAGLTLGLMGQDQINLQVIESTGSPTEQAQAKRVLSLLRRGKHWVLVTLLLANVVVNETLPIVLDRSIGGGWPAVVTSTAAIVIFGEIIPQSICVRYGLIVGAQMAPLVLVVMYLLYPIAYPVAMLLDKLLGEHHGTIYKRAGLKTLVTLHHNLGVGPERLNEDEVTIISAVLDLKDKSVGQIMTPIEDVFTLPSDNVLDIQAIEKIFDTGFNRVPIHTPNDPSNFIGMLLVRSLITYDPDDRMLVSQMPLAALPRIPSYTSVLNILNFFQEGKSHMALVTGAKGVVLGVLTLEDVIEELIGEEIIDESDVFIDVHNAIPRTKPGPVLMRISSLLTGRSSPMSAGRCSPGRSSPAPDMIAMNDQSPLKETFTADTKEV
uniref:ARAD1D20526p n=1 Tax=Blastobotrys adeninivorans TaxID=409370 RepID=A0A060TAL4_BLAAD